ncbi:MAG: hypothetical protein NC434_08415 [Ruminococcus sp.]|nr:hypothetical protein [Ruminococcus sp.]
MPEEQLLRLSDSFEDQKHTADVELTVRVLNINAGKNPELLDKCRVLKEYALFVDITRQYMAEGIERQTALNMAIDYCIDHDILSAFLQDYRAEVLGMLLEEFDVDKYERSIMREGIEQGIEQGMEQGIEKTTALVNRLLEQNRLEDIRKLTVDPVFREQLFREFEM